MKLWQCLFIVQPYDSVHLYVYISMVFVYLFVLHQATANIQYCKTTVVLESSARVILQKDPDFLKKVY